MSMLNKSILGYLSVITLCLMFGSLMFGCSKKSDVNGAKASLVEKPNASAVIGMPNPIKECSSEDILNKFGYTFVIPQSAENVQFSIISDSLAQVSFDWKGANCNIRFEPTEDKSVKDISGFYYDWKNSSNVKVGEISAKANWTEDGEGNIVGICIWRDEATKSNRSVSMRSSANKENLTELANAVFN